MRVCQPEVPILDLCERFVECEQWVLLIIRQVNVYAVKRDAKVYDNILADRNLAADLDEDSNFRERKTHCKEGKRGGKSDTEALKAD
jgi:hypothetical protein